MKFLDLIEKHRPLILEQDPGADAVQPEDATTPDPNATPEPEAGAGQPAQVAPEGYVDMVRMLIKATAMNFPTGALDELYRTEVTKENAFIIQKAVEVAIKQNELYADNPERLEDPNFKRFADSVNPNNFIEKLKQIEAVIKKQDPYAK